MATVLLSYLRWTAVSPTGSLQIFHSATNPTHFQLLSTVNSSTYWMKRFSFPEPSFDALIVVMSRWFYPYILQFLRNIIYFFSKCFRHIPKLKTINFSKRGIILNKSKRIVSWIFLSYFLYLRRNHVSSTLLSHHKVTSKNWRIYAI